MTLAMRSDAATEAQPVSKIDKALGDLKKLPLLPATAQQAMLLVQQEGANLQEISRLVERDITLAGTFLKLANSPLFSWGRKVANLDQAVVRLGLRECQNLILAASMQNYFQQVDAVTKDRCTVLWQHCFLTACLCRRLNHELKFGYTGEEFTAGLLHDLGRILLAVTLPEQFAAVDPLDFVEGPGIQEREQAVLETDHCRLGSEYALANHLPPAAVAAIRFHHKIDDSRDHRGIIGLVATADHMANFMQRKESPEKYELEPNTGFQFLARGWNDDQVNDFKRILPHVLKATATNASQPVSLRSGKTSVSLRRPKIEPRQTTPTVLGTVKSWFGK